MALASLTALVGLQATGGNAGAHQPEHDPATEEGTATGAFRPGLTKAGLASVEDLDDAQLWLSVQEKKDSGAKFDVRVELLNNGEPVAEGLRRCVGNLSGPLPPQANGRAQGLPIADEVSVPWGSFEPRRSTPATYCRCVSRPGSARAKTAPGAEALPTRRDCVSTTTLRRSRQASV